MKIFPTLIILPVLAATSYDQQQNNCTVVAKMTPEGDSVSTTNTTILFRNASLNATSYQFILNGLPFGGRFVSTALSLS